MPPYASEATRLLCVGTYLDARYRDRVIEELYLNEQRFVAPSLGVDAIRVLAHALRARRRETAWATVTGGLWLVGMPLTGYWLLAFLAPGLMLAVAPLIRGRAEQPPLYRALPALLARLAGRCLLVYAPVTTLTALGDSGAQGDAADITRIAWGMPPTVTLSALHAWVTLGVCLLITVCVLAERGQHARMLSIELSPQAFPDAAADPAFGAIGQRFRRVKQRIEIEQHSPLIIYNDAHPFCGAGEAYDTWVLPVDLRSVGPGQPQPLSNRAILDAIHLWLRFQSQPTPSSGGIVRDRQRWIEVSECVFLPADGLMRREEAPYHIEQIELHLNNSVEEGGEKRRHFLRVRIGGWGEELVITVYVRVHTHGRMLMLDVAPRVLTPVRKKFRDADRMAYRYRHSSMFVKVSDAFVRMPGSAARALVGLVRAGSYGWQWLTEYQAWELPDGPALSVRELGSEPGLSHFQELDRDRYVRGVQDRVAQGVRTVLSNAGYHTSQFVQQIVNVSNGGVLIESVEGSTFAIGDHASAAGTNGGSKVEDGSGGTQSNTESYDSDGGDMPQKGPPDDDNGG